MASLDELRQRALDELERGFQAARELLLGAGDDFGGAKVSEDETTGAGESSSDEPATSGGDTGAGDAGDGSSDGDTGAGDAGDGSSDEPETTGHSGVGGPNPDVHGFPGETAAVDAENKQAAGATELESSANASQHG